MEQNTVRLRAANRTDIGRNPARTRNEDYFGHFQGEYGDLFLVCDGMGGHEGGEIASRLAVESVRRYFETNYLPGEEPGTIAKAMEFAQQKIVEQVQQHPELDGMGTTIVLLLIHGVNYHIANVGDSRIYLSRGGALMQLTKDHSEVQMMVESGVITREQAATHPRRNFITRAIGHNNFTPDISGPHMLQQDDVFLLCSDGLTEYLRDDELHQQMQEEPQIACQNLVDLANERGGDDNITVQVVQVMQCAPFTIREEVPAQRKKNLTPPLAIIATLLVFLGAILWYARSLQQTPSQVTAAEQDSLDRAKKEEKTRQKEDKEKQKAILAKQKDAQKTKSKKAPAVDPKQLADIQAIDRKLGAVAPGKAYLDLFNKLSNKATQAKNLKFFTNTQGNQVVYIVPGNTVYLAFNKLGTKDGFDLPRDIIEAMIALAVVRSAVPNGLTASNWQQELFAPGTMAIDDRTWQTARELYRKYDATNADGLFNSSKRFGGYKKSIKAGKYSLSLDKPI